MFGSETSFNLKISSNPGNINQLEPFLQKVRKKFPITDDLFFNILIVLTEAVNNCIIHGNHSDPRKAVHIHLKVGKGKLRFFINDEGHGFNPEELPDPTSPERLACPNGRGVFLMKQLSDFVNYSNHGRKVEIHFSI